MVRTYRCRSTNRLFALMLLAGLFWQTEAVSQNNDDEGPSWIFPVQIHPAGIIWTDGQGHPYTGAAKIHFAKILGKYRPEENAIIGPTAGVRFVNLNANRWEGEVGLRFASRILRTAVPIDAIWALDAGISTEKRVPLGISVGISSKQGPGGGVRFAYDVNHKEPLLEAFATVFVFGRPPKTKPCKPDLPDSDSLIDRVALEAYTFILGRANLVEQFPTDLPDGLPADITNLNEFHDFLAGHGFPEEMISVAVMTVIIADAVEDDDAGMEDSRESALGLLMGWREGVRLIKCKGEEK